MDMVGAKRDASGLGGPDSPSKRQNAEGATGEDCPSSPPGNGDLPHPWQSHTSKRTNKQYWYNPDTKETTWFHPVTNQPSGGMDPQNGGHVGGPGGTIGASMPPGQGLSTNLPRRAGAQRCSHFLKTGSCKFGDSCRYDHPPEDGGTDPTGGGRFGPSGTGNAPEPTNIGLPLRPGEKECSFFMKTGNCKFGEGCRWHHPPERQQDGGMASMMKMGMAAGGGGGGGGGGGMANPMAMMGALMGAMAPAAAPPRPPAPATEWETHWSDNGRPYYFNLRTNVSVWDPPPEILMQQMGMMGGAPSIAPPMSMGFDRGGGNASDNGQHPVRSGEPDCHFFMKTGNCKFGDGCKFNHPTDKMQSANDHPVREGMPDCTFFAKTGNCKFGPSCKFNHPRNAGGQGY